MKSAVIVFPASNCDRDAADALARVTGRQPVMVWHGDAELPEVDLIVLPGGFSYGDYLRSGAMAAHSPVMKEVRAAAGRGVPLLGICNGFQVLVEAGLLPGALMRNADLRFVHRMAHLSVERADSLFTSAYRAGDVIDVPVAHHDGRYFADDETLKKLEGDGRVAFRYVNAAGERVPSANPNGSLNSIAGVFSADRRILGMMPHPERVSDPAIGKPDGRALFMAACAVAA